LKFVARLSAAALENVLRRRQLGNFKARAARERPQGRFVFLLPRIQFATNSIRPHRRAQLAIL